ncbi:MAG: CDGSH iron-sulfur domain-containing protein [Chlorobi bacterium]|nr:CDGSH iron-sulfur domain-containing protein [Chlorobiota bacterium]
MGKAKIVQKQPYVLNLEPGNYWWCACGESANQPFCDGSHKTTSFKPVKVEISEAKKVALCGCKQTGNKPFCDGSHNNL